MTMTELKQHYRDVNYETDAHRWPYRALAIVSDADNGVVLECRVFKTVTAAQNYKKDIDGPEVNIQLGWI